MGHMTLIRHGQANTGAQDEEGYDRLSDLGHQQARWLGDYLHETKDHYARVYTGTMRRHIETAESMGASRYAEVIQDPRLNEFPYFSLAQAMRRQFDFKEPRSREDFAQQIQPTLAAWAANELEDVSESFEDFSTRVADVVADIGDGEGRALVVTSGGFISAVLRDGLTLSVEGWAKMCLAIMNTSIHRWHRLLDDPILTQFNGVPHLETPDRHFAQTHL